MYNEFVQIKSIDEIETILLDHDNINYFNDREIKSVTDKNKIKSLGARYLIKKSILDFLGLKELFADIEIDSEASGRPVVKYNRKVEEELEKRNISQIMASISHSRNYIATLVVIE